MKSLNRMFSIIRQNAAGYITMSAEPKTNEQNNKYKVRREPKASILSVGEVSSYSLLPFQDVLLNSSWTEANDFDAKSYSIMNTSSDREYTIFHLHSFCATGVSNGLAIRVTLTPM
jgi:hypothetical protein